MYEYHKLKGRIYEKYGNQLKFAEAVSLTPAQLSNKLRCKSGISQKDMRKWAELLDISIDEYPEYFFA